MAQRRDKMEMARVETFVLSQIVAGSAATNIMRDLKAQFGFKTDVNCRKVIHKVTKKLEENSSTDIEQARAVYRQRYEDLYQRALNDGKTETARAILDSMAKIDGVVIQKIEQKVTEAYKVEFQ